MTLRTDNTKTNIDETQEIEIQAMWRVGQTENRKISEYRKLAQKKY